MLLSMTSPASVGRTCEGPSRYGRVHPLALTNEVYVVAPTKPRNKVDVRRRRTNRHRELRRLEGPPAPIRREEFARTVQHRLLKPTAMFVQRGNEVLGSGSVLRRCIGHERIGGVETALTPRRLFVVSLPIAGRAASR